MLPSIPWGKSHPIGGSSTELLPRCLAHGRRLEKANLASLVAASLPGGFVFQILYFELLMPSSSLLVKVFPDRILSARESLHMKNRVSLTRVSLCAPVPHRRGLSLGCRSIQSAVPSLRATHVALAGCHFSVWKPLSATDPSSASIVLSAAG